MTDAALGYYTVTDYIDPSLGCGGAYYTRSFALGMCIAHTNSSAMYSYDGTAVSRILFDTDACEGNATKTVIPLGTCDFSTSGSPANVAGFYQMSAYNAVLPATDTEGVDSL